MIVRHYLDCQPPSSRSGEPGQPGARAVLSDDGGIDLFLSLWFGALALNRFSRPRPAARR